MVCHTQLHARGYGSNLSTTGLIRVSRCRHTHSLPHSLTESLVSPSGKGGSVCSFSILYCIVVTLRRPVNRPLREPRMATNFSSVVNSPRQTWATFLGLPDDLDEYTLEDVRLSVSSYMVKSSSLAPSVSHERERQLTLSDFTEYMRRVGQPYAFMAAHRSQLAVGEGCDSTSFAAVTDCSAGLKQVPPVCFEVDFKLSRPRTFDHFSPPDQPYSSMVTLEKLAGHLDTVCPFCQGGCRHQDAMTDPDLVA